MARMAADKADARDRAHTLINLEMRRHTRRLKQTAEDYIAMRHDEAVSAGLPFDHEAVALDAVREAERVHWGLELGEGADEAAA